MSFSHIPVLAEETIERLNIRPDGVYIDGTAGGGGHSALILERLISGTLVCLDRDPDAIAALTARFSEMPQVRVVNGNFSEMAGICGQINVEGADGILLDLGVSSHQLDTVERGFSFHQDAGLDMRMSQSGMTAAEFIAVTDRQELARIIRVYGEDKFAGRIARAIKTAGESAPITTTAQLAEIIASAVPAAARRDGHPARQTFQAIRIALNEELYHLEQGLTAAFDLLRPGGRLAVITFHSLEDRPVKQRFIQFCTGCECPPDFPVCICGKTPRGRLIGKKPVTASEAELKTNPRCRSAKLRVIEKIEEQLTI